MTLRGALCLVAPFRNLETPFRLRILRSRRRWMAGSVAAWSSGADNRCLLRHTQLTQTPAAYLDTRSLLRHSVLRGALAVRRPPATVGLQRHVEVRSELRHLPVVIGKLVVVLLPVVDLDEVAPCRCNKVGSPPAPSGAGGGGSLQSLKTGSGARGANSQPNLSSVGATPGSWRLTSFAPVITPLLLYWPWRMSQQ